MSLKRCSSFETTKGRQTSEDMETLEEPGEASKTKPDDILSCSVWKIYNDPMMTPEDDISLVPVNLFLVEELKGLKHGWPAKRQDLPKRVAYTRMCWICFNLPWYGMCRHCRGILFYDKFTHGMQNLAGRTLPIKEKRFIRALLGKMETIEGGCPRAVMVLMETEAPRFKWRFVIPLTFQGAVVRILHGSLMGEHMGWNEVWTGWGKHQCTGINISE